jgi:Tripartite tricarboxylate transporter TctB family
MDPIKEAIMIKIRSRNDLITGLVAVAFSLAFLAGSGSLKIGTLMRMGPGFFPTLIAWCLLALGSIFIIKSLSHTGGSPDFPKLRPIVLIALGPVLFGLLLTKIGLFLTVVSITLVARAAMSEAWNFDSFIMPLGLAAFCSAVFVFFLGQPIPLWP